MGIEWGRRRRRQRGIGRCGCGSGSDLTCLNKESTATNTTNLSSSALKDEEIIWKLQIINIIIFIIMMMQQVGIYMLNSGKGNFSPYIAFAYRAVMAELGQIKTTENNRENQNRSLGRAQFQPSIQCNTVQLFIQFGWIGFREEKESLISISILKTYMDSFSFIATSFHSLNNSRADKANVNSSALMLPLSPPFNNG